MAQLWPAPSACTQLNCCFRPVAAVVPPLSGRGAWTAPVSSRHHTPAPAAHVASVPANKCRRTFPCPLPAAQPPLSPRKAGVPQSPVSPKPVLPLKLPPVSAQLFCRMLVVGGWAAGARCSHLLQHGASQLYCLLPAALRQLSRAWQLVAAGSSLPDPMHVRTSASPPGWPCTHVHAAAILPSPLQSPQLLSIPQFYFPQLGPQPEVQRAAEDRLMALLGAHPQGLAVDDLKRCLQQVGAGRKAKV